MGYFYGSGVVLYRYEQDLAVGRGYAGPNSWRLQWKTNKFHLEAKFLIGDFMTWITPMSDDGLKYFAT